MVVPKWTSYENPMLRHMLHSLALVACAEGSSGEFVTPTQSTPSADDAHACCDSEQVIERRGADPQARPRDGDSGLADVVPQPEAGLPEVGPLQPEAGLATSFHCRLREVGDETDTNSWVTGLGGRLPLVTLMKSGVGSDGLGEFEATWHKGSAVLVIRATPADIAYEVVGTWTIGLRDERAVTTRQPGPGNFLVGCWVE